MGSCPSFARPFGLFAIVLQVFGMKVPMVSFSANARPDLFPESVFTTFFVLIDEAQVAADHLKECFRSAAGADMCPIIVCCWSASSIGFLVGMSIDDPLILQYFLIVDNVVTA